MAHNVNRLFALGFVLGVGATSAQAAPVSGMGTWETTLHARDLDGDHSTIEAYYDSMLDITWLQNYHYGRTTGGPAYENLMTWGDAMAWAQNLDINGITGWRLPSVNDTGTPGCNYGFQGTDCGYNVDPSTGELAHLYYVTLGMVGDYGTDGEPVDYRILNEGPFYNSESDRPTRDRLFWSSTEYVPDTNSAWWFVFSDGEQASKYSTWDFEPVTKDSRMNAWGVHDGDVGYAVSAVPVPAAAWLLASGLLGLVGLGRRRRVG